MPQWQCISYLVFYIYVSITIPMTGVTRTDHHMFVPNRCVTERVCRAFLKLWLPLSAICVSFRFSNHNAHMVHIVKLIWFKIVYTVKASAHSFKQFTSQLLKLSFSLSMHIYNSDGRHAWFHLHGTSRPDRSASEATKYKMKNSLSIVGLEPSTLRFHVWCSTYWASRAWWKLYV